MVIKDILFRLEKFSFEKPIKVSFAELQDMEVLLIKILTDEGITGYGEAAPLSYVTGDDLETALAVGKKLRTMLLGSDPRSIGEIHRIMDSIYQGNAAVKAGIDIACYDIAAKSAGIPLYRHLGGNCPKLISDVTIGIDTPDEMAAKAVDWSHQGFDVLKIKLGEDIQTDAERICRIRDRVGPDIELRVDANQGWTVKNAIQISSVLAEAGVTVLEQPVPAWNIEGLKEVKERILIDVAADESCHSIYDAAKLASAHAVDMVNIKLMKCGGIYNAIKISAICEAAGIRCMIGCMGESTLANAAGMHLAAALDNIREVDLDSAFILRQDKVSGGLEHNGGDITLLDVPGIGCNIKDF